MKVLSNFRLVHGADCELLCFDGRPAAQSTFDPRTLTTLPRILESLPPGWVPDVVLFKSPSYYPVPLDIEACPFPTVALLDDWFGSVDYLPDNLRRFDCVAGDRFSVSLLEKTGLDTAVYWPCFGFDPRKFRLLDNTERSLDVTFAGSFNVNIQLRTFYAKALFSSGRSDEGKAFVERCLLMLSRVQMATDEMRWQFETLRRMFDLHTEQGL